MRWSLLTGVDDDQDAVWEIVAWFVWREVLEDEREARAAAEIAPQTGPHRAANGSGSPRTSPGCVTRLSVRHQPARMHDMARGELCDSEGWRAAVRE
jgi:hypothetical protein